MGKNGVTDRVETARYDKNFQPDAKDAAVNGFRLAANQQPVPAQSSPAVESKAAAATLPPGVTVTGSDADKKRFLNQIRETTGLDVKIGADGRLAITGEDKSKGNKVVAKAVRDAIEADVPIEAKLVHESKWIFDSFESKEINVNHLEAALRCDRDAAGALLTHVFVERKVAAEEEKRGNKEAYDAGHAAALKAEAPIFGLQNTDFRRVPSVTTLAKNQPMAMDYNDSAGNRQVGFRLNLDESLELGLNVRRVQ